MIIQDIKSEFVRDGIQFNRIEVSGKYQLFQCQFNGTKWYEIILPKFHKASKFNGKDSDYFSYPKDEDFGKIAWTYNKLALAKDRLEQLSAPTVLTLEQI